MAPRKQRSAWENLFKISNLSHLRGTISHTHLPFPNRYTVLISLSLSCLVPHRNPLKKSSWGIIKMWGRWQNWDVTRVTIEKRYSGWSSSQTLLLPSPQSPASNLLLLCYSVASIYIPLWVVYWAVNCLGNLRAFLLGQKVHGGLKNHAEEAFCPAESPTKIRYKVLPSFLQEKCPTLHGCLGNMFFFSSHWSPKYLDAFHSIST